MKACHIHDPARWDRTLCGLRLYMGVPSKRCPIYGELPTSHRAEWYPGTWPRCGILQKLQKDPGRAQVRRVNCRCRNMTNKEHTMEAIITHKTRTCHKCKGTGERGFHAADGMGCNRCGGTANIPTRKAAKSWALVQAKRTELSVAPYAELAVGDLLGSKRVLYVSIRGDQVVYAREGEVRPEGFHIFRRAAITGIYRCEITAA